MEYLIRIVSGDGAFTVNFHAPGYGRATNHESLAGAFGIPDFKSPPADAHKMPKAGILARYTVSAASAQTSSRDSRLSQ